MGKPIRFGAGRGKGPTEITEETSLPTTAEHDYPKLRKFSLETAVMSLSEVAEFGYRPPHDASMGQLTFYPPSVRPSPISIPFAP